jgi:hypothetical protein
VHTGHRRGRSHPPGLRHRQVARQRRRRSLNRSAHKRASTRQNGPICAQGTPSIDLPQGIQIGGSARDSIRRPITEREPFVGFRWTRSPNTWVISDAYVCIRPGGGRGAAISSFPCLERSVCTTPGGPLTPAESRRPLTRTERPRAGCTVSRARRAEPARARRRCGQPLVEPDGLASVGVRGEQLCGDPNVGQTGDAQVRPSRVGELGTDLRVVLGGNLVCPTLPCRAHQPTDPCLLLFL